MPPKQAPMAGGSKHSSAAPSSISRRRRWRPVVPNREFGWISVADYRSSKPISFLQMETTGNLGAGLESCTRNRESTCSVVCCANKRRPPWEMDLKVTAVDSSTPNRESGWVSVADSKRRSVLQIEHKEMAVGSTTSIQDLEVRPWHGQQSYTVTHIPDLEPRRKVSPAPGVTSDAETDDEIVWTDEEVDWNNVDIKSLLKRNLRQIDRNLHEMNCILHAMDPTTYPKDDD